MSLESDFRGFAKTFTTSTFVSSLIPVVSKPYIADLILSITASPGNDKPNGGWKRTHPLWGIHDRILFSLMNGLAATEPAIRTKTVRSLVPLLTSLPPPTNQSLLDAIATRLTDSSAIVREAAVDGICGYALERGDESLWRLIIERTRDVKVSVRKRSIKAVGALFGGTEDVAVEAGRMVLARMGDEETSVRVRFDLI